jgi:hypothetical protein
LFYIQSSPLKNEPLNQKIIGGGTACRTPSTKKKSKEAFGDNAFWVPFEFFLIKKAPFETFIRQSSITRNQLSNTKSDCYVAALHFADLDTTNSFLAFTS